MRGKILENNVTVVEITRNTHCMRCSQEIEKGSACLRLHPYRDITVHICAKCAVVCVSDLLQHPTAQEQIKDSDAIFSIIKALT